MNKVSAANDALWTLVQAAFPDADGWTRERNPSAPKAPKPRSPGNPAMYCDQLDDEAPQLIRAFAGLLFDLKATSHVTFVFLGGDTDRRVAAWAAVEELKAALAADPTLGGAVEYARIEAATDAAADRLEWMAGGLRVPVAMLFNAPSEAG